jgi:hypothetical protein
MMAFSYTAGNIFPNIPGAAVVDPIKRSKNGFKRSSDATAFFSSNEGRYECLDSFCQINFLIKQTSLCSKYKNTTFCIRQPNVHQIMVISSPSCRQKPTTRTQLNFIVTEVHAHLRNKTAMRTYFNMGEERSFLEEEKVKYIYFKKIKTTIFKL